MTTLLDIEVYPGEYTAPIDYGPDMIDFDTDGFYPTDNDD